VLTGCHIPPRHHAGRPRLDLPDRWSTPRWVPVRSGDRAGQSPHRAALHTGPGPRPAQLLPHAAVLSVVGELADPRDVVLRRRNGRDGDHEATLSGDGRQPGATTNAGRQNSSRCLSQRRFPIQIHRPHAAHFRSIVVEVGTRRRRFRDGQLTGNLRGLPAGRIKVRVIATTTRGQRIGETRHFHTCAPATG